MEYLKNANAKNDLNVNPRDRLMFNFNISYYDNQWAI